MPDTTNRARTIRSFVRRTGRQTASQQKALDELWPEFGFEPSDQLLDYEALFVNANPVVLEIGFGNGESLVDLASAHPQSNFIGVEVHDPGIGHCMIKAKQAHVSNLRLINHDAIEVLEHQIPDGSLQRVNLYFPDPWPKKRHHKRRIVQHEFLERIANKLATGGSLHIATDWAPYAEHIDEVLESFARFQCTNRCEHDGSQPLERSATKFERRGLKKGHRIVDWIFTKTS